MRAVVQRVSSARVTSGGEVLGEIGRGMLVLVCAIRGDTDVAAGKLAEKLAALRIFPDAEGRMNLALDAAGGEVLVVPQFTLAADLSRGNRPGFDLAAPPGEGRRLCDRVVELLGARTARPVRTGRFGADMQVSLVNDGPATFLLECVG
ncbi:MAG: D-tyrosyl-tRNA(Tyr) deacylase [Candidatus Brocadiae bacterium]|nr:D-tyrosyl-tRNA(Tyr) deacylase [Candidatus Brocadiia bacterium]